MLSLGLLLSWFDYAAAEGSSIFSHRFPRPDVQSSNPPVCSFHRACLLFLSIRDRPAVSHTAQPRSSSDRLIPQRWHVHFRGVCLTPSSKRLVPRWSKTASETCQLTQQPERDWFSRWLTNTEPNLGLWHHTGTRQQMADRSGVSICSLICHWFNRLPNLRPVTPHLFASC